MLYNTGYEALLSGVGCAILAQILKVIFYYIKNKKINFKIFTTTGGMPSSHSGGIVGLATSTGLISGFDSVSFAIASGLAIVVMYDAAGVRRAAGKTAATLNRVVRELCEHNETDPYGTLKELLGHTPKEVIAGAIFGIAFAYCLHYVILA